MDYDLIEWNRFWYETYSYLMDGAIWVFPMEYPYDPGEYFDFWHVDPVVVTLR